MARQRKIASSEQSKRFAEAARELGCPDDADAFDRTLKKVASAPPPKSVKKRKDAKRLRPMSKKRAAPSRD